MLSQFDTLPQLLTQTTKIRSIKLHPHLPSPFIIIAQPEVDTYRPTEGRRLSRSYRDDLITRRGSPIQVLTGPDVYSNYVDRDYFPLDKPRHHHLWPASVKSFEVGREANHMRQINFIGLAQYRIVSCVILAKYCRDSNI